MVGSRIQRAAARFCTFFGALFFASVVGLITTIFAAYVIAYCVGLPILLLMGEDPGSSAGGATVAVAGISLVTFSLLVGVTLGEEVYVGMALPEEQRGDAFPGWVRALWAAAAGAFVGSLPVAVMADILLLGPHQTAFPTLNPGALATHLISLGGLTGAMTGLTMERFRIWRRSRLPQPRKKAAAEEPPASPSPSCWERDAGGEGQPAP